jgi:MFS family permease
MSISRMTQDSARFAGALTGAGLFVAFGMGPSYVAITGFYTLGALLLMGAAPESREHRSAAAASGSPRASPWRDLKEGIAYIWSTPRLNAALWLAFFVNLTAFPLVTGLMPYIAKEIYRVDQTGLGYLIASIALGAVGGSVVLSVIGERMRAERVMLGSLVAWHVLLLALAHTQNMSTGIACLFAIGFAQSLSVIALAVILLGTAAPQFRGRVMGLRMLAIYGHPMGLLAAGALIGRIGFPATATLYGVAGLAIVLGIVICWRAHIWRTPVQIAP